MRFVTLSLMCLLTIFSCKNDPSAQYPKLDLLQYGFPIEINAPEGAEVKKSDLGVMSDITVRKGDNYYVQIFSSDATTIDAISVKSGLLTDIKATPYFSKVIEEYDNGFLFEKKIDARTNYDFRFVKLQGDREYVFQTGLIGTYTEADVRSMYKSVQ